MNSKTYILKSIYGLSLFAAVCVLPACKKSFLDVPVQASAPSQTFWVTAADAAAGVNSTYANLHSWTNLSFAPMAVESLGSDDAEKGSDPSDATFMNAFNDYTASSPDGQILDFWSGQFQTINLANQVLDNIPNINMDASLKNRYLAEMKFIRAYEYFRLVRAFGDVPLRLKVPKDPTTEYNIPRSPKAQVYAAIETDLNEAATVLPNSYGSLDVGRATKGAALALHAKVAMYQQKWADVLNYTNQVMALGYSLFPNYEAQFRVANENNSESVFEIQCKLIPGNSAASNSQYSVFQGIRGVREGGWGFNVPTASLAAAFETGDPRRDATIIFRGETTPDGDLVPTTVPNAMYNQKSYVPYRYYVDGFNSGADQNFRAIRFADVLLMNAEAANEQGLTTQALASLERVRARARGSNLTILPPVTTTDKTALRNAIWRERRVELAMENDRYFDVIRQGRGTEVFGPLGWKAGKNEVWPIPRSEIDLSNGILTQNPGY